MGRSELYHVGIVVPDIDAAKERLTALLGVEWGPVAGGDLQVRGADGAVAEVPLLMCYSTTAPYLELIREIPGTPWVCNEHSNLHHIGFFHDDLVGNSEAFAAMDCPLELTQQGDGPRPVTFTYHRDPLGVRIEHVDTTQRAGMEQFLMQPPA